MSERARRETSLGETDAAVLARRVESSAHAIATTTSGQVPVTARQRIAALALALDLLATAGRHGVTRADLDGVVTLAGAAVDAILARDRRREYQRARQPAQSADTRPQSRSAEH
jgi:hypothetical protein